MMIFYAFGVHINVLTGILISSSYIVLTYISILPGSAGIGELANLYILNSLGLGNYYLMYDVWFRVVTYIVPLIILMPAFLSISRKLTMIDTNHKTPSVGNSVILDDTPLIIASITFMAFLLDR